VNTKLLLAASSVVLGIAGLGALFAPGELLAAFGAPAAQPLPVVIQLMGALYVSFALANWTAKDSLIGGIYARPVSFGNFVHFGLGALTLARYLLTGGGHALLLAALVVYAVFAGAFGWLVFVHPGRTVISEAGDSSIS
jgi:hypothetical protein